MTWYDFMINAAKQSRHNSRHWFRYLRKVIFEDYTYLTVQQDSPTHEHVVSLNKPANVEEVKKLMGDFKFG